MERPIIVAELGSGGMADVFLAMRRGTGGFVKLLVIKRLREGALEGDAVEMFHDEARISARLNHPNVVQTQQVSFDGQHHLLEMEYLDGQPLHRIVNRAKKAGRAIPFDVSVAVVRGVLAGLRYAHELRDYDGSPLNIVHRDVSPQNVFVTYDGSVKLVDFGIAKMAGQSSVTQVGMVKGKVRYMAPEQATGRPIDARVDVFAAGVILWQLLVGHTYWQDIDDIGIFHRLSVNLMPRTAREANPEIPEELDRICSRALAADPAERYASAEEFYDALESYAPPGTGGEQTIGKLAADLFADVRQAIRLEIEKAATRPLATEAGLSEPPTQVIAMLQNQSGEHPRVSTSESPVSSLSPLPAEVKRSWFTLVASAAAVALAAVALQVFVLDASTTAPATRRVAAVVAPSHVRLNAILRGRSPTEEPAPPAASDEPQAARTSTGGSRVTQHRTEPAERPRGGAPEAPVRPVNAVVDAGAAPVPTVAKSKLTLDPVTWDAGGR